MSALFHQALQTSATLRVIFDEQYSHSLDSFPVQKFPSSTFQGVPIGTADRQCY
jgi:hypothetical protein